MVLATGTGINAADCGKRGYKITHAPTTAFVLSTTTPETFAFATGTALSLKLIPEVSCFNAILSASRTLLLPL